jgi:hypothetical protein
VVTECAIDPLHGGSFKITDAAGDSTLANVGPDAALHWLSLKKGDIAEITWMADASGIENFLHISRANGAVPRNPSRRGELPGQRVLSVGQPMTRTARSGQRPGLGIACHHHDGGHQRLTADRARLADEAIPPIAPGILPLCKARYPARRTSKHARG